jgi:hypothetical protein
MALSSVSQAADSPTFHDLRTEFEAASIPTASDLNGATSYKCIVIDIKNHVVDAGVNTSSIFVPFKGEIIRLQVNNFAVQSSIPAVEYLVTPEYVQAHLGGGLNNSSYMRIAADGTVLLEQVNPESAKSPYPISESNPNLRTYRMISCSPN